MIYKFDKQNLTFKSITKHLVIILLSIILLSIGVVGYVMVSKVNQIKYLTQETKMLIIKENNGFSEDKLINEIKNKKIKFPHIVLAQAKIESSHYKSQVFKNNNNLFGMRYPNNRQTTAIGEELNHAKYDTWINSVIDYAFWQISECKGVGTDEDYLKCLSYYAENPNYVSMVKNMSMDCKEYFE
jgi:hypothetical protein